MTSPFISRQDIDFSTIFWDEDCEAFFFVDDNGVTACGSTPDDCIGDYMIHMADISHDETFQMIAAIVRETNSHQ